VHRGQTVAVRLEVEEVDCDGLADGNSDRQLACQGEVLDNHLVEVVVLHIHRSRRAAVVGGCCSRMVLPEEEGHYNLLVGHTLEEGILLVVHSLVVGRVEVNMIVGGIRRDAAGHRSRLDQDNKTSTVPLCSRLCSSTDYKTGNDGCGRGSEESTSKVSRWFEKQRCLLTRLRGGRRF